MIIPANNMVRPPTGSILAEILWNIQLSNVIQSQYYSKFSETYNSNMRSTPSIRKIVRKINTSEIWYTLSFDSNSRKFLFPSIIFNSLKYIAMKYYPLPAKCKDPSFPYLSFSLPDVLCYPTDLIWRKGTPFEAITGRTASSSNGLLAEVFWGFPQL